MNEIGVIPFIRFRRMTAMVITRVFVMWICVPYSHVLFLPLLLFMCLRERAIRSLWNNVEHHRGIVITAGQSICFCFCCCSSRHTKINSFPSVIPLQLWSSGKKFNETAALSLERPSDCWPVNKVLLPSRGGEHFNHRTSDSLFAWNSPAGNSGGNGGH